MKRKIIGISTIPGELHPALGPKYLVRFDDQTTKQIYAEWFFDMEGVDFDPFKPHKGLIGLEVSDEWVQTIHSNN